MSEIGPDLELTGALIEMHVRSDIVIELLTYAAAALAQAGEMAARGQDGDAILDHVSCSLDVIHGRIRALAPEETS